MLASASGVAFFLNGAIKLIFASRTIPLAIAHMAESDASIVRASKLILATVISWAILLILAIGAVRLAITNLQIPTSVMFNASLPECVCK